jgi:O-antigen/teichoic acid export membrane protein
MVGSAINALLYLPYILQLAFGWTKLPLLASLISISILVPLMFPMTKHFGPVGAALIWPILNVLNMLITVPIMHRRLLPRETWRYFSDIGVPLLCTTATAAVGRFVFTKLETPLATLAVLAGLWLASLGAAVVAAPLIRAGVRRHLSKLIPSYA